MFHRSLFISLFLIADVICQEICELIQHQQEQVLLLGETDNSLLVITKSLKILEQNKSALSFQWNVLRLTGARSYALESFYPAFQKDKHFSRVKGFIHSGFVHSYNGAEYLILHTDTTQTIEEGILYDMKNKTLSSRFDHRGNASKRIYLPIKDKNGFYEISNQNKGRLELVFLTYEDANDINSNLIEQKRFYICKDKANYFSLNMNCVHFLYSDIDAGLIMHGNVVLFQSSGVIIFSENLLNSNPNNQSTPYPYKEKSYQAFINCGNESVISTVSGEFTFPKQNI